MGQGTDPVGRGEQTGSAEGSVPLELEVKLTAADRLVLDQVATLDRLGDCRLVSAGRRVIHDTYWDTPAGDLGGAHMSLRIRQQDGVQRLTWKESLSTEGGLFRRGEVELLATAADWSRLREQLWTRGIPLEAKPIGGDTPSEWLRAAGLIRTQERSTERRVLYAERAGQSLAELALDVTTFHLGLYDVTFRELEIESLTDQVGPVVSLGAALQRAFPDRLAPSRSGKYSLGLKLAARLAETDPGTE